MARVGPQRHRKKKYLTSFMCCLEIWDTQPAETLSFCPGLYRNCYGIFSVFMKMQS